MGTGSGGIDMGTYIESSLVSGETIVAEATTHWGIYVTPGIVTLLGVLVMSETSLLLLAGVIWLAFRYFVAKNTELALTNKRVIAKSGIIRRNFIDVSLSKVEGVVFHQGIIARMLGYGSISVRGTGTGQVPIPFIDKPEEFKQEVGRILHAS